MPRGVPDGNAEIREIRHSLHSIVDTLVHLIELALSRRSNRLPAVSTTARAAAASRQAPRPRARMRLSRERRAELRLQGEYMGRLRRLKPAQKARVKALRASKGFPAAIRLAARLAS